MLRALLIVGLAASSFIPGLDGDQIARAGYIAVFLVVAGDGVFPILPGETAIVAAAVLAAQGDLQLPLVILAGALGAVAGDSLAYAIGHHGRGPIRRHVMRVIGEGRLHAAERMVTRYGPALVFVGRFLPGLRIAVNVSCGAGQMPYRRFLLFDSLGAIVWSTQAAVLGYIAGKAFADQVWVAFVVAIGVTLLVGAAVGYKERQRMRAERRRESDPAGNAE
jgi:membrane-associated protein